MAGHSKWANIRYRKAQQDAKKGKIFTKLIREIVVAAQTAGALSSNSRLKLAVEKAQSHNMTRETIERAISRAQRNQDNRQLETILYEGYGPQGSAILIEAITDNRNRTAADVRSAFSKMDCQMASSNAVNFLFEHRGILSLAAFPEEEILLQWLEDPECVDIVPLNQEAAWTGQAGQIHTTPTGLYKMLECIKNTHEVQGCDLVWIPKSYLILNEIVRPVFEQLLERLEGLEDVQAVYHNVSCQEESVKA